MSPVKPPAKPGADVRNSLHPEPGVPNAPHDFLAGSAVLEGAPEDRGIVERPILAPHRGSHVIAERAVVLASETTADVLYGRLYVDLVPLLDGTRDRHEIAAALQDRYSTLEVQTALVSMATKGYVCSADYSMDAGSAAFWAQHGVSPLLAERRLAATPVRVAGDGEGLAEALQACGVALADGSGEEAALTVVATVDYIAGAHKETNRRHLASGRPWLLVAAMGVWPLAGPVFRPADGGPCWHCLVHRLGGNREVERFLRLHVGDRDVAPRVAFPPHTDAVRRLFAVEVARWIVSGAAAPIHEHAICVSANGRTTQHRVMRRPQCSSCGDERLHRPDRAAAPVKLRSSPKPVRNSGGVRSVSPRETVRRFRHLVDPVSGVVTQLERISSEEDSWLHLYWAGSNLALNAANLAVLRSSLRTKSSGKGASAEQAEASALGEALERYSGVFHGDEIRRLEPFSAFADGEAIHPNDIQHFSDSQLEQADDLNVKGTRFNFVPRRLDPDAAIYWSPVWSLTHQRHRYLPTTMLYYSGPVADGQKHVYATADSNGCAAGNTFEEAILQGFLELAERDAFACWWYNRLRLPEIDIDSFGDSYLSRAHDYYRRRGREFWLLDVTNDLGIPVFVGVSRRTGKGAEDILFSAGAHIDPLIAAFRTVCEMNQYLDGARKVKTGNGEEYAYDDPESVHWWRTATLENSPWLAPDPAAAVRLASDYAAPPDTGDVRDDVELCRKLVEGRGMEFLVLDQTRPDVGLPVAKVIVPDMRHFWARFAPGRLYDVPVQMGWLEQPLAEAELNPVHVFI